MTQPDMPSVMQAAKRLRRVYSGEDRRDVYGTRGEAQPYDGDFPDWLAGKNIECDLKTLADFALSVLPSGERPVAMEDCRPGMNGWGFSTYRTIRLHCFDEGNWTVMDDAARMCLSLPHSGPVYTTEADARLALHWQALDNLAAASRASGTDQRRGPPAVGGGWLIGRNE